MVIDGTPAITYMYERCLRERREQLVSGMRGEDRGTGMCRGIPPHGIVVLVHGIEARIPVPGFVEMNSIAGLFEQGLGAHCIVTKPVIGAVRQHCVHGFLIGNRLR